MAGQNRARIFHEKCSHVNFLLGAPPHALHGRYQTIRVSLAARADLVMKASRPNAQANEVFRVARGATTSDGLDRPNRGCACGHVSGGDDSGRAISRGRRTGHRFRDHRPVELSVELANEFSVERRESSGFARAPVGDADSAETANEYLSANGAGDMTGGPLSSSAASGASFAALDLAYVNPEASGTAPYYSGSSYAPTKTYTTTSTDPVPISPATLAAMAQPMQLLQGNNLASEIQAMASSSPAAADLSNIARSGIGGLETGPDDVIAPTGVAQMPADLPPPGTTTPVAIVPAAMTSAFELLGGSPTAALISEPGGALSGGVLDASFAQSRWLAGLVSGTANADLPSIEQAVGRLCERMERWGEELFRDAGEWRLSESLVLAAAAAAAFEYVRAQGRESGSGPFAEDNREPWQPRLRKPFGRPADSKRRFLSRHRDQA